MAWHWLYIPATAVASIVGWKMFCNWIFRGSPFQST